MAKPRPNIYVMTDLEGISGIYCFAQTRDRSSPLYAQAVEYLMGDIAALVRGLREGGAGEILVVDGHGGGNNFVPHLMEPGARYITGRPREPWAGLDRTWAGLVLLGYHAMHGTPDGVLHHTENSLIESRYWYNGRESGEITQCALIAGAVGVPVIMVTGDAATCREARDVLGPAVVTVATKRGLSREAAELFPFADTRQAIGNGAQHALGAIAACKPCKLRLPIRCRREWIERSDLPSQTRVMVREAAVRDVMRIIDF
jgi:D-amino peptidase